MSDEKNIVARASADAPEILETDALDSVTGGVEYGGTNTCEPVKPTRHRGRKSGNVETTWKIEEGEK